jgi:hypothetical protein
MRLDPWKNKLIVTFVAFRIHFPLCDPEPVDHLLSQYREFQRVNMADLLGVVRTPPVPEL